MCVMLRIQYSDQLRRTWLLMHLPSKLEECAAPQIAVEGPNSGAQGSEVTAFSPKRQHDSETCSMHHATPACEIQRKDFAIKIHRTAASRFKLRTSTSVVSIEDSFAECLGITIFTNNNR